MAFPGTARGRQGTELKFFCHAGPKYKGSSPKRTPVGLSLSRGPMLHDGCTNRICPVPGVQASCDPLWTQSVAFRRPAFPPMIRYKICPTPIYAYASLDCGKRSGKRQHTRCIRRKAATQMPGADIVCSGSRGPLHPVYQYATGAAIAHRVYAAFRGLGDP